MDTMAGPARTLILIKSIQQLGLRPVLNLAFHRLGYKTGYYYRQTVKPPALSSQQASKVQPLAVLTLPPESFTGSDPACIPGADEIVNGMYRPFYGSLSPLDFAIEDAGTHWTRIGDSDPQNDLKLVWEPARFCWVSLLVRAFRNTGNARFVRAFWQYWHRFQESNIPYCGPNWVSAQEVAIRLINWTMALQFFGNHPATRADEREALIQGIFIHAYRIPCTISYAKAQKNNHLLTEAAGLFTAGCLFKHMPEGRKWMRLGWKNFNEGILSQVDPDGTYIQHSINYHRLMLQTSFWMSAAARTQDMVLPPEVNERLAAATRWLLARLDLPSGMVSNLGHNDGTYLFPLAGSDYGDYRPTAQTAASLYLNQRALPAGPWDEMAAWFNSGLPEQVNISYVQREKTTSLVSSGIRVNMHTARYTSRPAHADQLQVELWWDGENILQDGGTYRYTAPFPWDNRLARSAYHNTLTIDDQEPMLWVGRFLWLDWDQHQLEAVPKGHLAATHAGYEKAGYMCKREIRFSAPTQVEIVDSIEPFKPGSSSHLLRLHWLLPAWEWNLDNANSLTLLKPGTDNQILIETAVTPSSQVHSLETQLVCAGEVLHGQADPLSPTFGWISPTYNHLAPALSFRVAIRSLLPAQVTTRFTFKPS